MANFSYSLPGNCESELLGSREEVVATLSEMLVADCEFTEKQRREIFEEIKRLHKGQGS